MEHEQRLQKLENLAIAWVYDALGRIYGIPRERALRLLEEVIELTQAHGCNLKMVHALVDHVYARPVGTPEAESAAVVFALYAYFGATLPNDSVDVVGYGELSRITQIPRERLMESLNRKINAGLVSVCANCDTRIEFCRCSRLPLDLPLDQLADIMQKFKTGSETLNQKISLYTPSADMSDAYAFKTGGIRSHKAPRFDLIPRVFLACIADRLELGLAKKGDREILQRYRRGTPEERTAILADESWWTEMKNHLQEHVTALITGELGSESLWGHVGAIAWNALMFAWRYAETAKSGDEPPVKR